MNEGFNGMELLELVQKRNTRELVDMKRKKLLAMGLDIDGMSYEVREKYYREVDLLEGEEEEGDDGPVRVRPAIDEGQIIALIKNQVEDIEKMLTSKISS